MKKNLTLVQEYGAILGAELLLLILILLGVDGLTNPLGVLRMLLGFVVVLFIPGYLLQMSLFPERQDVDIPERAALSVGLSIALIPPIALLLDATHLGLQTHVIMAAEIVLSLILAAISWGRRRRLTTDRQFQWGWNLGLQEYLQDKNKRPLVILVAVASFLAVVVVLGILFLPRPNESFTELYILNEVSEAKNFPRYLTAGDAATLLVGVHNHENRAITYHIVVEMNEQILVQTEPFLLEAGESIERPLTFTPPEEGTNIQTEVLLYREGDTDPYRSTYIWMNVDPQT